MVITNKCSYDPYTHLNQYSLGFFTIRCVTTTNVPFGDGSNPCTPSFHIKIVGTKMDVKIPHAAGIAVDPYV